MKTEKIKQVNILYIYIYIYLTSKYTLVIYVIYIIFSENYSHYTFIVIFQYKIRITTFLINTHTNKHTY